MELEARRWISAACFPRAIEAPDLPLVVAALKGSAAARELQIGKKIHRDVTGKSNYGGDLIFVANSAIRMYGKCGSLADAVEVFERMPAHSSASWNSVMVGYTDNGRPELALGIFFQGVRRWWDDRSFVVAAMSCSKLAEEEEGRGRVDRELTGLATARRIESFARVEMERNCFVANAFVDMFAKCGSLVDAFRVFEAMPQQHRDVVSWTALITACVENGRGELALEIFSRMVGENFARPNAWTYVAVLKACEKLAAREDGNDVCSKGAKVESLARGRAIHRQAEEDGCSSDRYVATSLLDLYAKCGSLEEAEEVFDKMVVRDVVAWNTLVLGYVENGKAELALTVFNRIVTSGCCQPDSGTFVAALRACSSLATEEKVCQVNGKLVKIGCLEKAMNLHALARTNGAEKDVFVANTLIHLYADCGSLDDSWRVFEAMERHSVVSWNSLILGYVESGENSLALQTYTELKRQGRVCPNARTFVAVLMACGALAAFGCGKDLHSELSRFGFDEFYADEFVSNVLVDFYGRCGCLVDAKFVFDAASTVSLVSWSSLISGYSQHGNAKVVLNLFQGMMDEKVRPDCMVFSSVLGACSHAGMIIEGRELFRAMRSKYGVEPDVDHYNCMIDLLGRANFLEEAVDVVGKMPVDPTPLTWITILGACSKWKNADLGLWAFQCLVDGNDEDELAVAFVLLEASGGSLITRP